MPIKGKKSLAIDEDTHKAIARESVDTGRDMYELVADAWAAYQKSQESASPNRASTHDEIVNTGIPGSAVDDGLEDLVQSLPTVLEHPGGGAPEAQVPPLEFILEKLRQAGAQNPTSKDELKLWGILTQYIIMSKDEDLPPSLKHNLLTFGKVAESYEHAGADAEAAWHNIEELLEKLRAIKTNLERDRTGFEAGEVASAEREARFKRAMEEVDGLLAAARRLAASVAEGTKFPGRQSGKRGKR